MGHKYGDLFCFPLIHTSTYTRLVLSLKRRFHRECSEKYRGIAIFSTIGIRRDRYAWRGVSSLYYPRHSLCATPIRHDYRHLYSGINRATAAKAAAFAEMPLAEGASRASATRSLGWLFRKIGINENRRGTRLPPRLDVRQ